MYDVVVVGGGAAGLIAAGMAAERGASVLLLERKHRIGMKLRITGKGKCNITNTRDMDYYRTKVFGPEEVWVKALEQFTNRDIVDLLEANGLPTVIERGDRVYPKSGKAADVVETLVAYVEKGGATILLNALVEHLKPQDDGSIALGVNVDGQPQSFIGRSVIMATGGKSYPSTGSDGQAYGVLQEVGHTITELYPALVAFETLPRLYEKERFPLKNVGVELRVDGQTVAQDFGDMELTPEGVGGSTILRVSREAVLASNRGKVPVCVLDLKPSRTAEQLAERIERDVRERSGEQLFSIARAWLPAPLVPPVLRFAGANP
ncbi:MAG: aminoacetone oxidase family FAD-binding enzyme, partial [Bacteroidetes bacterium]